jgi:hypothetical protein
MSARTIPQYHNLVASSHSSYLQDCFKTQKLEEFGDFPTPGIKSLLSCILFLKPNSNPKPNPNPNPSPTSDIERKYWSRLVISAKKFLARPNTLVNDQPRLSQSICEILRYLYEDARDGKQITFAVPKLSRDNVALRIIREAGIEALTVVDRANTKFVHGNRKAAIWVVLSTVEELVRTKDFMTCRCVPLPLYLFHIVFILSPSIHLISPPK